MLDPFVGRNALLVSVTMEPSVSNPNLMEEVLERQRSVITARRMASYGILSAEMASATRDVASVLLTVKME